MNYDAYLINTYTFSDLDFLTAHQYTGITLYSDNTYTILGSDTMDCSYSGFINTLIANHNANYTGNASITGVVFCDIQATYKLQVIPTIQNDYIVFTNTNYGNISLTYSGGYAPSYNTDLRDLTASSYYKGSSYGSYNQSSLYGAYQGSSLPNISRVYDYTCFEDISLTSYREYNYHIGGINFYNHNLGLNLTSTSYSLTFSFGNGYQQLYNAAYDQGLAVSYHTGYQQGLTDGQQYSGLSAENATAFSYIGGAFIAVNNILSLEVLPHITLGTCFSIPLVLILITTIFKLVKK